MSKVVLPSCHGMALGFLNACVRSLNIIRNHFPLIILYEVECDQKCTAVLRQRQQDGLLHACPIWHDVRQFTASGTGARGILAGFPCQAWPQCHVLIDRRQVELPGHQHGRRRSGPSRVQIHAHKRAVPGLGHVGAPGEVWALGYPS